MTEPCQIRTSKDTIEPFDVNKIIRAMVVETTIDINTATQIAHETAQELKGIEPELRTSALVREIVNTKMAEKGYVKERNKHTRVGLPVFDIINLIKNGSKDNANMIHNPETIHKHVADQALKEFALLHCIPSKYADLHREGAIHIHDLEFFAPRSLNCMQHDLREFIKYGLKVDGTGEHTSVAGPPNHMETLMNHSGEIMLAAQQHMSGGQSMSLWNVFVAPFARGRSYEEIKQAVQMFIYNLNMAYAARGSQVPFTSVSLEFTVPKFLQDVTAYGPGGKACGTYGDYEDEVRQVQRAFTETLMAGDAYGKPHLFPNTIYQFRKKVLKDDELKEDFTNVHDVMAKFGTPYLANMEADYRGKVPFANYMGCRTCLNPNWTEDWELDCFRTGNASYISTNLPRIAYDYGNNESLFYERLDELLCSAADIMQLRLEHSKKCLNQYNLLPFLRQTGADESDIYYRIENATLSFGFVGLNEMVGAVTGLSLVEDMKGEKLGLKVIKEINKKASELTAETGLRFSVLQSPAESTAHRFAKLDVAKYAQARKHVNGTIEAPYYTNSSHVPVDRDVNIIDRIKIEEKFHPLTLGGHIFHAWMGESYSDPAGLASLSSKIGLKSDIGFWAYSSILSFCLGCKTMMKGKVARCPECGSEDVEYYDRITGYIQQLGHRKNSIGGWNAGKMQEFHDRRRFNLDGGIL